MKFRDIIINREHRFCIGMEEETGKYYVCIPVSNQLVDYSEYYEIDSSQFTLFQKDTEAALDFVNLCRQRKLDHLLMQKPGRDRGIAS